MLVAACEGGYTDTAQLIINEGAETNSLDSVSFLNNFRTCIPVKVQHMQDGRSPLVTACSGGHSETARLLIDNGAEVNKIDTVSIYTLLIFS